jgi:hypothetical protein
MTFYPKRQNKGRDLNCASVHKRNTTLSNISAELERATFLFRGQIRCYVGSKKLVILVGTCQLIVALTFGGEVLARRDGVSWNYAGKCLAAKSAASSWVPAPG